MLDLRTGASWRNLPPNYGDWKDTHRRFCRWRSRGEWAKLLEALIDNPNFEWLMIDASYINVHPRSAGARYKLGHLVKNGFLEFKQWRGIATPYAKGAAAYLAACQLRAAMIWTKLI